MLSEHNEAILGDIGLSDEEIASLYSEQVLVHDPGLDANGRRRPVRPTEEAT